MEVHVSRAVFSTRRQQLLAFANGRVDAEMGSTGIETLHVQTDRLQLQVLPFRGQQIWQAWVDGQPIGMKRPLVDPAPGRDLLLSFGAFLFHCGLMGTAAPGPGDSHPLHGELPQAEMRDLKLDVTEEEGKATLTITSHYDHHVAFGISYRASPFITIRTGETVFEAGIGIENLSGAAMPFAYMAHPNFRPVDGAELVYSAIYSPETVRVRSEIPGHLGEASTLAAQVARYLADPTEHHLLSEGQPFAPEVVFQIDYMADRDGWAHSLQIHPDGTSDWLAHRPSECPRAVRWLCRTADMDAIAIAEPTTSWISGFKAENAAGRIPALAPRGTWGTRFQLGRLDSGATSRMRAHIDQIAGRA